MSFKAYLAILGGICCLLSSGCNSIPNSVAQVSKENIDNDSVYQISTIQALTAGDFYGSITATEMMKHGNIGLGTFRGVNGEMIVVDGKCYQAIHDGTVLECPSDIMIPFASVTNFEQDYTLDLNNDTDMKELIQKLDKEIEKTGKNYIYAGRIDGFFSNMLVRSEIPQKEPYRTLDKVMETDQTMFNYQDIEGTVVMIYFPSYASGVNVHGWHMHFISKDKTIGGHVLDLELQNAQVYLDKSTSLNIVLPDTEFFSKLDLLGRDEAIHKVEKGE